MMDVLLGFLAICLIAALIRIAFAAALWVLIYGISGAVRIFAFAAEQGFIGIAACAACWVFMFPLMLTASVIVGRLAHCAEQAEERARSTPQPISPTAQADILIEAGRARGEHQEPAG